MQHKDTADHPPARFYCRYGHFHPVPRLALECTVHDPEREANG